MVERCREPGSCCMARLTIVTEVSGDVVRICRLLKISLMALITVCVLQLIVAVRMTRLALYRSVLTCKREGRGIVIECRRLPRYC